MSNKEITSLEGVVVLCLISPEKKLSPLFDYREAVRGPHRPQVRGEDCWEGVPH